MYKALTIAGSDSGGGAGIEADLKTFSAFNVYGMASITSITAQNTLGVQGIQDIPAEMVGKQIDSVVEDIGVEAAKTGMLSNSEIVETVSDKIREHELRTVVDPVMVAESGDRLLKEKAVEKLKEQLVPRSHVITPNIPEAEILSDLSINGIKDMKKAARKIHEMGANYVVVKGGHSEEEKIIDVAFNGENFSRLIGEKYDGSKHGTGCTFSSAITANLAKKKSVKKSIEISKDFINKAIKDGLDIGEGEGPVNHFVE